MAKRVLAVDDEKSSHVITDLIFPAPKDCTFEEHDIITRKRKAFEAGMVLVKTIEKCLIQLKESGPWDILCLDYDLGDRNATEITDYLEKNTDQLPNEVYIVSFNPPGRKQLAEALEDYFGMRKEWGEVIYLFGKVED